MSCPNTGPSIEKTGQHRWNQALMSLITRSFYVGPRRGDVDTHFKIAHLFGENQVYDSITNFENMTNLRQAPLLLTFVAKYVRECELLQIGCRGRTVILSYLGIPLFWCAALPPLGVSGLRAVARLWAWLENLLISKNHILPCPWNSSTQ
jgi:hypothetical protein